MFIGTGIGLLRFDSSVSSMSDGRASAGLIARGKTITRGPMDADVDALSAAANAEGSTDHGAAPPDVLGPDPVRAGHRYFVYPRPCSPVRVPLQYQILDRATSTRSHLATG